MALLIWFLGVEWSNRARTLGHTTRSVDVIQAGHHYNLNLIYSSTAHQFLLCHCLWYSLQQCHHLLPSYFTKHHTVQMPWMNLENSKGQGNPWGLGVGVANSWPLNPYARTPSTPVTHGQIYFCTLWVVQLLLLLVELLCLLMTMLLYHHPPLLLFTPLAM